MEYPSVRCRAVVDWIDLEIHTVKPTNFMTVQKVFRQIQHLPSDVNPYVEAVDEGPGGAASVFRVRIQDPKNSHVLDSLCSACADVMPLQSNPKVTAIEIAFDAYNSSPEQAARFYKYITFLADKSNHRLYRAKSDITRGTPLNFQLLISHLAEGWQVGIGNKSDDCYQHIYWKTTDNGVTLPPSEHRARVEITLRGASLPMKDLDDLRNFNFATLAKYFQFRELKDDLSQLARVTIGIMQNAGERSSRRCFKGGSRL